MPVTCSKLGDDGWVDVWQFTGGPDKFERRDRRDEYRNDLLDANGFAHATRNNLDPGAVTNLSRISDNERVVCGGPIEWAQFTQKTL